MFSVKYFQSGDIINRLLLCSCFVIQLMDCFPIKINTFVEISFRPKKVFLTPGEMINSTINITINNKDYQEKLPLTIYVCCLNPAIASAVNFSDTLHITNRSNFFTILLKGNEHGVTNMIFYIIRNKTSLHAKRDTRASYLEEIARTKLSDAASRMMDTIKIANHKGHSPAKSIANNPQSFIYGKQLGNEEISKLWFLDGDFLLNSHNITDFIANGREYEKLIKNSDRYEENNSSVKIKKELSEGKGERIKLAAIAWNSVKLREKLKKKHFVVSQSYHNNNDYQKNKFVSRSIHPTFSSEEQKDEHLKNHLQQHLWDNHPNLLKQNNNARLQHRSYSGLNLQSNNLNHDVKIKTINHYSSRKKRNYSSQSIHKAKNTSLDKKPKDNNVSPKKIRSTSVNFIGDQESLISDDLPDMNSTKFDVWLLSKNYEIIVESPIMTSGHVLQYIVIVLVVANMIGIGGQIDGEEVISLLKRPVAIGISLLCRFGIMPAIGLGIVEIFYPSSYYALGVLAFVLSPTEGLSNLLALLSGADLTLSVIITCVNNFASGAMLSLWAILFEKRIYDEAGKIQIPFRQIYVIFTYLLLAPAIGFIIKLRCPEYFKKFWKYLPFLTSLTIMMQLIVEIIKGYYIFTYISVKIFMLTTLLVCCGFLFSVAVAFISRHPFAKSMAIILDAGIRNTLVSHVLLSSESLHPPISDYTKTIPVLASILSLSFSSLAILIYRLYMRYKQYQVKKSSSNEFSQIDDFEDNCEDSVSSQELLDLTVTAV